MRHYDNAIRWIISCIKMTPHGFPQPIKNLGSALLLFTLLIGGCSSGELFGEPEDASQSSSPVKVEPTSTPSPTSTSPAVTQAEPSPEQTAAPTTTPKALQPSSDSQLAVAFTDIDELATKNYITDLNKLGVFEVSGDTFRPYDPITRGEYIIWLYKANNAVRPEGDHIRFDPTFDPGLTDIKENHPAYKYVQAFANAGFAVGYEDKTFKPDQVITREEMIAIKVGLDRNRVQKPLKSVNSIKFADAEQITSKYTGYIFQGSENIGRAFGSINNFKPQQAVKRHEAAATLGRVGGRTTEAAVKKLESQ